MPAAVVVSVLPLILAPVVPALATLHVIVLLVALEGSTIPVRVSGVPAVALVGMPVMFVTATKAALTVIEKSWV